MGLPKHPLTLCLFASRPLCVCLCLSLSVSVCLCLSLSVCLSVRPSVCLSASLCPPSSFSVSITLVSLLSHSLHSTPPHSSALHCAHQGFAFPQLLPAQRPPDLAPHLSHLESEGRRCGLENRVSGSTELGKKPSTSTCDASSCFFLHPTCRAPKSKNGREQAERFAAAVSGFLAGE